MPDMSTLTIDVDPSQVNATTEALDRLAEAAERASAALDKLRGHEVRVYRAGDVKEMVIKTVKEAHARGILNGSPRR